MQCSHLKKPFSTVDTTSVVQESTTARVKEAQLNSRDGERGGGGAGREGPDAASRVPLAEATEQVGRSLPRHLSASHQGHRRAR